MTEAEKARSLSQHSGVEVTADQILQCHTPYKTLASTFGHRSVFLLGKPAVKDVMIGYGFKKVFTVADIVHRYPGPLVDDDEGFAAAFIVHDPIDWGAEMQVLSDILIDAGTSNSQEKPRQVLPLFACNADLVYTTEYHRPRFTQGAFVESFRTIFEKFTKSPLEVSFYGKPFSCQYRLAEEMLVTEARRLDRQAPSRFYGIGDNPVSDIRGANNAGELWSSVLVCTGIFTGAQTNDIYDPADFVAHDLFDAVNHILSIEKH